MPDDIKTTALTTKNREALIKKLANEVALEWMKQGLYRTCLNCINWNDRTELCQKYKSRPPLKVIVTGCEEHDDEIPF